MNAVLRRVVVFGFLLCAAPVGLAAAWWTPPMQAPDEAAHTVRAAGLLRGVVLGRRLWAPDPLMHDEGWQAGVKVSQALMNVALAGRARHGPISADVPNAPFAPAHVAFFYAPNTLMYFPAAYVPAALGLAVVAHGGAAVAYLAARLGGLVAYLALGAVALRIARRGQALLLAVLLLPLPLLLSGAITQDAILLGVTCVGVAALTRGAAWLGLAALTLLAAAKPPYAPLLLLYVLPVSAAGVARRVACVAVALVLVGVWVGVTAWQVDVPFDVVNDADTRAVFYHPGPLYPGDPRAWFYMTDPAAQLSGLVAHPLGVFSVVIHAVGGWRWPIFYDLIGRFGRLELPVGWWLGVLWGTVLLGALVAGRARQAGHGWAAALLILGSFWAVMLSLYLDNTPIGAVAVVGFYPRYFLPLLPCLVLAWPRPPAGWRPVAPVLALGLFDAVYLTRLLWRAYG